MIFESRFWAGTEDTLQQYVMATLNMQADVKQAYGHPQPAEEDQSRLLTQSDGVAIISISGSLNNSADAYRNEWRGATGYPEIRKALVQAANNQDVTGILLDINSGGGMVSGVQDTADLIRRIDTQVKPVYAYTDGMAASAAYWLGSSARRFENSKVAEVGSVGVLTIHQEVSKMLSDYGITATVIRAGEFKALGNPYEKLSDKAKAEIQGQLDQLYRMFVGHVADRRGVSYDKADAEMAQGRVFLGERAVAVGLSDGISNFDSTVSRVGIDTQKSNDKYGPKFDTGSNVKIALTDQSIAALAEGGSSTTTAETPTTTETAPAEPVAVGNQEPAPAPSASAPAAESDTVETPNPVVAYLERQLSDAQATTARANLELSAAQDRLAKAEGTLAAFRSIASASVSRLKVALGLPSAAVAQSDEALLAEHTALREQFETKFKAGGVAAVSSAAAEKSAAVDDPVRSARIQATRPKK